MMFGQPPGTPAFGATTATPSFNFGAPPVAPAAAAPAPTTSWFGGATAGPSAFATHAPPTGVFGAAPSISGSAAGSLFTSAATPPQIPGSLGAVGQQQPQGRVGTGGVQYRPTQDNSDGGLATLNVVCAMPEYKGKSLEELRWEDTQIAANTLQQSPAPGGLFGAAVPGAGIGNTGMFGGPAPAPVSAFGVQPAKPTSPTAPGSLFGVPTTNPPAATPGGFGLFPNTTATATAPAPGNIFGAPAPAAPAAGGINFGMGTATGPALASFPSFGATPPASTQTGGLFSNTGAVAATPANPFGGAASSLFNPPAAAPSIFGSATPSGPAAASTPFGSFGNTAAPTPATSALVPSFGFNVPAPAAAPIAPAASAPSLFSFPSAIPAATAPAAPAQPLFGNFGSGGPVPAPAPTVAAPAFSFGLTASAAPAVPVAPATGGPGVYRDPYGELPDFSTLIDRRQPDATAARGAAAGVGAQTPLPRPVCIPRSLSKMVPRRQSLFSLPTPQTSSIMGAPRAQEPQTPGFAPDIFHTHDKMKTLVANRTPAPARPSTTVRSSRIPPTPRQPQDVPRLQSLDETSAASQSVVDISAILPAAPQQDKHPAESAARPTVADGVVLPKQSEGYFVFPKLDTWSRDLLATVPHLTICREGHGQIDFIDNVDLRGVDLSKLVTIEKTYVSVYEGYRETPDENGQGRQCDDDRPVKPPVGQGLNVPANVTLFGVLPKKRRDDPEMQKTFCAKLQDFNRQNGSQFIRWEPDDGKWVFKVPHF